MKKRWPLVLLLVYLIEFAVLAFNPHDRTIWISENAISVSVVAVLLIMYRYGMRFSNTAYTLMALFLCLHTVGGHYTFELVPFDAVTDFFGFKRNHFDRVCHFLVGVFAYPALEIIYRKKLTSSAIFAGFTVIMGVFGFAAIFELVEWIYAELAAPEAGNAFLGSQGDIWDAQKDMLSDGLGAICTTALYFLIKRKGKTNEQ